MQHIKDLTLEKNQTLSTQPRKKILVAEDNEDLRTIFSYALKRNFEVSLAVNGKEALQQIETFAPDLLVLDINMPEMTGLEVIKTLQEQKTRAHMKIIVVTGNNIAIGHELIDFVDMALVKPVDTFELATLVQRLLLV
jgi:CheY-like chemotaxis protein